MKDNIEVHFWSAKKGGKSIQDLKYATEGSAAVDIRSAEDFSIKPYETKKIKTGLYVSIPKGYCMKVYPRSGISAKTSLIFKNTTGIIDSDYRALEIFVLWYNLGDDKINFEAGDRVAQCIVEEVVPVTYIEVNTIEELQAQGISRGGGMGSTGLK